MLVTAQVSVTSKCPHAMTRGVPVVDCSLHHNFAYSHDGKVTVMPVDDDSANLRQPEASRIPSPLRYRAQARSPKQLYIRFEVARRLKRCFARRAAICIAAARRAGASSNFFWRYFGETAAIDEACAPVDYRQVLMVTSRYDAPTSPARQCLYASKALAVWRHQAHIMPRSMLGERQPTR